MSVDPQEAAGTASDKQTHHGQEAGYLLDVLLAQAGQLC